MRRNDRIRSSLGSERQIGLEGDQTIKMRPYIDFSHVIKRESFDALIGGACKNQLPAQHSRTRVRGDEGVESVNSDGRWASEIDGRIKLAADVDVAACVNGYVVDDSDAVGAERFGELKRASRIECGQEAKRCAVCRGQSLTPNVQRAILITTNNRNVLCLWIKRQTPSPGMSCRHDIELVRPIRQHTRRISFEKKNLRRIRLSIRHHDRIAITRAVRIAVVAIQTRTSGQGHDRVVLVGAKRAGTRGQAFATHSTITIHVQRTIARFRCRYDKPRASAPVATLADDLAVFARGYVSRRRRSRVTRLGGSFRCAIATAAAATAASAATRTARAAAAVHAAAARADLISAARASLAASGASALASRSFVIACFEVQASDG